MCCLYRSSGRDNALQLCGWKFDKDGSFLDRLELEGRFSRAAAVAIFNLKLREAIEILNRGDPRHQPHLAMTAMALSGKNNHAYYFDIICTVQTFQMVEAPFTAGTHHVSV